VATAKKAATPRRTSAKKAVAPKRAAAKKSAAKTAAPRPPSPGSPTSEATPAIRSTTTKSSTRGRKVEDASKQTLGSKETAKPRRKSPTKRKLCFVISPFGGWFDTYYEEIFQPAIKKAGLAPCRADDLFRPSSIVQDIWQYVQDAEIVLADLTGKNPNVLYELGLAHALDKPVVMVSQVLEDVPFDLRALRVTTYDTEDPKWASNLHDSIASALNEVLKVPQSAVLQPFNRSTEQKPLTPSEVTSAEIQMLERRVNSLQAQIAASPPATKRRTRIAPKEAIEIMAALRKEGVPDDVISSRLEDGNVPRSWVSKRLAEFDAGLTAAEVYTLYAESRRPASTAG